MEAIIEERTIHCQRSVTMNRPSMLDLVPHSYSPLSLDDVSSDSIRAVAHALILCSGQAQSIDRCAGRKDNIFSSPAQHSFECSLAKMTLANLVGQIR